MTKNIRKGINESILLESLVKIQAGTLYPPTLNPRAVERIYLVVGVKLGL